LCQKTESFQEQSEDLSEKPGDLQEKPGPVIAPMPPEEKKVWPWIAGVLLVSFLILVAVLGYKFIHRKDSFGLEELSMIPTAIPTTLPDHSKELARNVVDSLRRTRDPNGVQSENFESFVSLGYARAYGSSVNTLKGVVKSLYQSPFTEKDLILRMENADKDIVFINRDSLKKHVLEALRRVGEGGKFYASENPRMFTIANTPGDVFNNFKKAMITLPVPLEGQSVSMDQIVEDVASLLREIGKGTPEQNFAWLFFFFGSSQGSYQVYLQEVQVEPFEPGQFISARIYTPSSFVRISKRDAEAFLEERFSRETKPPCVLESNEEDLFELDFKISELPGGSHQEACFEQFAEEVVAGLIKNSDVN